MRIDHTLDVPASRFIFVHYHIFKNGGTTIESILRREFGGGFATVHGPRASSVLDAKGLTKFLRLHPGISAVSSHHLRYPKPDIRGWVFRWNGWFRFTTIFEGRTPPIRCACAPGAIPRGSS